MKLEGKGRGRGSCGAVARFWVGEPSNESGYGTVAG